MTDNDFGWTLIVREGIEVEKVESFNVYTTVPGNKKKVIVRMRDGRAKVLTGDMDERSVTAP